MNFVEPIRARKKIAQIKNLLRGQRQYRDLLLFVVGINTALRISDLLELRVEHFLDNQQLIKHRFWIKEQKRGKRQEVVINNSSREVLEEYLAAYLAIITDHNHFGTFLRWTWPRGKFGRRHHDTSKASAQSRVSLLRYHRACHVILLVGLAG